MSITIETAKAHANDPAVTCCRYAEGFSVGEEEAAEEEVEVVESEIVESNPVAPAATTVSVSSGYLKLHIGEGKDIDLQIPLGVAAAMEL